MVGRHCWVDKKVKHLPRPVRTAGQLVVVSHRSFSGQKLEISKQKPELWRDPYTAVTSGCLEEARVAGDAVSGGVQGEGRVGL